MSAGCLACGGSSLRLVHHLTGKGDARIVACEACTLVQLETRPTPAELEALYAGGYFEGVGKDAGYEAYSNQEAEYFATFDDDLRRIGEFLPGGTVLDVGCGYGYFVRRALAAGYDAYGIDLSAEGIQEAEKHAPGRFFRGTLGEVDSLAGRRFDVLFASHLIEHITEPAHFLATCVDHLTEEGLLVLVTPNVESWLARISGPRWVSFKIPEHVAYYSPRTMRRLLDDAGLEVVVTDPAYQFYRLPFLMSRIRELIRPVDRLLPGFENWPWLRQRTLRVTSGSMRVLARPRSTAEASG